MSYDPATCFNFPEMTARRIDRLNEENTKLRKALIQRDDTITLLRRQLSGKTFFVPSELQAELDEWKQRAEAAESKVANWERRCQAGFNKVDWLDANEELLELRAELAKLREQEPVAWAVPDFKEIMCIRGMTIVTPDIGELHKYPLYAIPMPVKDHKC